MDDAALQPYEVPRQGLALPPLSKRDAARAAALAKELVRSDDHLDDLVTFGSDAQEAAARITKDMLAGVRLGTVEDVMKTSDSVLAELRTVDVGDLFPSARRIFWIIREMPPMIRRRIRDFFRRYELIGSHLDRLEAEIFACIAAATDSYNRDRTLADLTLKPVRAPLV